MPGKTMGKAQSKRLWTTLFVVMLCIAVFSSQISALGEVVTQGSEPAVETQGMDKVFVPNPKIDVEKYVSVDGGTTWLDADSSGPTLVEGGCDPMFKFVVKNTGNVPLTCIELSDTVYNDALCAAIAKHPLPECMMPGDCYEVCIEVDFEIGEHINQAVVYANAGLLKIDDCDTACYVGEAASPEILLEKSVSVDGGKTWVEADEAPGPVLNTYTLPMFKLYVKNTGNVDLTHIKIKDLPYQLLIDKCEIPDKLCPGEDFSIVINPMDLMPAEFGKMGLPDVWVNEAEVCATYCDTVVTDCDKAYFKIDLKPCPEIDVEKLVSVDGGATWADADEPGLELAKGECDPMFKFIVKNTGNVPLYGIKLTDNKYNDALCAALLSAKCIPECLMPGDQFEVCITVPFEMGPHCNTAKVCALFGLIPVEDCDDANYCGVEPCPEIDVEKLIWKDGKWEDADEPGLTLVMGENVPKFKFVITNTGNVTLNCIELVDSVYYGLLCDALEATPLPECLKPGECFEVCIEAPFVLGPHCNIAAVGAKYCDKVVGDHDEAHYCGIPACPEIDIEKLVSVDGGETWEDADFMPGPTMFEEDGDPMFKFVVKNTGNVTLDCIKLIDNDLDLSDAEYPECLKPGECFEVVASEPWRLGQHINIATVSGEFCGKTFMDIDSATYIGSNEPCPRIDVEKLVSVNGGKDWMDADEVTGPKVFEDECMEIMFKFIVKNTGNVTLSDIMLTDSDEMINDLLAEAEIPETLKKGDHFVVVVEAPWHAGQHDDTATASGTYDEETVSDTDMAHYFGCLAMIDVMKTVANHTLNDGVYGELVEIMEDEQAIYKVVVKNTGTVALCDVYLTDDMVMDGTMAMIAGMGEKAFEMKDGKVVLWLGDLEPGEARTITYLWQADAADVGETIENTAMAHGDFYKKHVTDSDTAAVTVTEIPLAAAPGIKLEKWVENLTAGSAKDDEASGFVGDTFRYTLKVMNTGDTALSDVVIHDSRAKVGSAVWVNGVEKAWADDGTGRAKLVIGDLAVDGTLTLTYAYVAVAADEGEDLVNLAHVTARYGEMALESSDTAKICVQDTPPQTGERDNGGIAGLALMLSGLAALVLRRKLAFLR